MAFRIFCHCSSQFQKIIVLYLLSFCTQQVEFPPDLCSRVTFVNFTVTRSSLQSQCLNQVLKAERPDVDEKRSDLLKLQGNFVSVSSEGTQWPCSCCIWKCFHLIDDETKTSEPNANRVSRVLIGCANARAILLDYRTYSFDVMFRF